MRGGLVLGVDGLALVLDVGDVAVVMVGGVGDGLEAAVGEVHLRRIQENYSLGQKGILYVSGFYCIYQSCSRNVLIIHTGKSHHPKKP